METGTTDKADTADTARPMSFDATLAVHNANHPESRLTDITAKLETACGRRLITLLHQRFPHSKAGIDDFGIYLNAGFPDSYQLICFCAGFLLARSAEDGIEWEDVKQVMQTGKGTPAAAYLAKRAVRAARLLNRLLTSGCLTRGEV